MAMKGDFWQQAPAARRYRAARPYFHPHVMTLIRNRIGLKRGEILDHGIDIGCGTGQSSIALLEIATSVTGIDSADQMLANAEQHEGVTYLKGTAEEMPVSDRCADIITASLAFHWFDVPTYLAEAARVLRPGGWLVTYSNHFRAQMIGNPEFHDWCGTVYGVRYPTPPRQAYDPVEQVFEKSSFQPGEPESYSNEVTFTPEQLVAYLMTHSNVIAAVEQGAEDADEVATWLDNQVHRSSQARTPASCSGAL